MLASRWLSVSEALRDFDYADAESLKQLYDYR